MVRLFLCLGLLLTGVLCGNQDQPQDLISIIIGGLGGGISSEVVTRDKICSGSSAKPQIPQAGFSSIFGWSAAVYSNHVGQGELGDLLLCGGKALAESDICHILPLGSRSWRKETCRMNRERTNAAIFTTNDGKIVISGGYSSKAGWLSDIQLLDSYKADADNVECIWSNIGTIDGRGVYSHCALQYDEDHYVFIGGNTWDSEGQYDIGDVQRYNIRTGEWTRGKDIPIPRQSHGCIKTNVKGRDGILVAGGFCNGNPHYSECSQLRINSTAFYDFENDSWEELGGLNFPRDGLTLQNIEGTIMAIGGEHRGQPVRQVEQWTGTSWTPASLQLLDDVSSFAYAQVPKSAYQC